MTLHDAQMIDPKILEEYDKKHKDPATMDKSELLRLVYDLTGEKYQLEQELDKLKKDNSELEVDYHNVASTASLGQEKASQDTDILNKIRKQLLPFSNINEETHSLSEYDLLGTVINSFKLTLVDLKKLSTKYNEKLDINKYLKDLFVRGRRQHRNVEAQKEI